MGYAPAHWASLRVFSRHQAALCAVLKRYKAAYFTHIRDEANKVMEGIAEAIEIARVSGVHVEVVHLKCSGVDNWGKAGQILDALAAARSQGCDIDCDAYPYTAGANPLKNYCRPGFNSAASRQCWRGLPYRKLERRIQTEFADHGLNNWGRVPSWESVQISVSPNLPQTAGQTVQLWRKHALAVQSIRSAITSSPTVAPPGF